MIREASTTLPYNNLKTLEGATPSLGAKEVCHGLSAVRRWDAKGHGFAPAVKSA